MSEMIKKMIRSKFDKGIEIPNISLENINKTLKEMDEITNEMLNPFDSEFDKIVKDIRDRQDNAMAMEFTKCIGELLRKNGVVPKLTEYTRNFETDKTFETRYGVCIDELDFSEHDKVFEDKIAELEKQIDRLNEEKSFLRTRCMPYVEKDFDNRLYGKLAIVGCNEEYVDMQKYADGDDLYSREVRNLLSEGGIKRLIGQYKNLSSRLDKMSAENQELKQITKGYEDKIVELKKDYKTTSELLGKYQQENEALKKRIIELENFSCQAEQETESLVEKLKQRIAELESKEVEKPTKCTTVIIAKEINGQTYVTLDDFMSVVNDFQAEIGT